MSRPAARTVVETGAPVAQTAPLERPRLRLMLSSAPTPEKRSVVPAPGDNPFLALL